MPMNSHRRPGAAHHAPWRRCRRSTANPGPPPSSALPGHALDSAWLDAEFTGML
ncbi:MAG: hypothetical protein M3306_08995 [Actinomycetota bacterium]|nr:hypothetical protein [Actinomycetota bacterium]